MADDRFTAERLDELAAVNGSKEAGLRAQGVDFRPELVFRLTVMALKDMLIDGDEEARLEFEVRYQELFAQTLADAQEQVNRAKLTSSNGSKPRLLRPPGSG